MSANLVCNLAPLTILSKTSSRTFDIYLDSASIDLINSIAEIGLNVSSLPLGNLEATVNKNWDILTKISSKQISTSEKRSLIKKNSSFIRELIHIAVNYLQNESKHN